MPQNNIQLILILVIFGFSFLRWVFRKLSEQAKKNRAQAQQRADEEDALRTGRVMRENDVQIGVSRSQTMSQPPMFEPPSKPMDAESARLAELARKRQELIAELRRRQQGGSGASPSGGLSGGAAGGGGAGASTGRMGLPAQSGPQSSPQSRSQPSRKPSSPAARPRPTPPVFEGASREPMPVRPSPNQTIQNPPAQQRASRPRPEKAPQRPRSVPPASTMPSEFDRSKLEYAAAARAPVGTTTVTRSAEVFLPGLSRDELRRAIVTQEILNKPVSLRE
jgi:hypothetical protein